MTLEELNERIVDGSSGEMIRVFEAKQVKALSRIADDICARSGVRLVLLAGGSSAGKTTTSKRLCTQLRVNGREAILLSTDDYFVGDARNPRDEQGQLDYEHVDCVDVPLLVADLSGLFRGERVPLRRFDFVRHCPAEPQAELQLPADGVVVIEGLHALNPKLTQGLDDALKYRIHIDLHPTLELFGDLVPKAADVRFLRRLVRDNQFRKMSPAQTVKMWPKVLAGERRWIEPFVAGVDAEFDSYLGYELAVLKMYAGGLLELARHELGDDRQVINMIRMLAPISPLSCEKVPGDSILRETIGGSQLEY